MSEDWRWFIGVMAGFLVAAVGIIRNLYAKISANSAELHKRIDDVKDGYVRQDHLDRQMVDLKERISEMKDELKGGHEELKTLVNRAMERRGSQQPEPPVLATFAATLSCCPGCWQDSTVCIDTVMLILIFVCRVVKQR